MVWTKRFFSIVMIILGLYLFGDFRINDVNVRDFLHQHIKPQNIAAIKEELLKALAPVYQMVEVSFKDQTTNNSTSVSQSQKPEKSMDQISEFDQKRMQKLLEKNLNPPKDKQPRKKDQQATDYLQ